MWKYRAANMSTFSEASAEEGDAVACQCEVLFLDLNGRWTSF
jgi:hypothetical protein